MLELIFGLCALLALLLFIGAENAIRRWSFPTRPPWHRAHPLDRPNDPWDSPPPVGG